MTRAGSLTVFDYLSGVGKRGHSSDRGRHRGPVGILRSELIEGSEGRLVDLSGIAMAKSSQCVAERRERTGRVVIRAE